MYQYHARTGQIFYGMATAHTVTISRALAVAMRRPGANRSACYALRAFFRD